MRAQRLGNYRLVTRLALGGMGELYLARQLGPRGFARTVALKRILPHLAEDQAFVEMFLNEARLAARLAHPNVVSIIELGEHDGAYFLTMEYVHGRSLRAVLDRLRATGAVMPEPIAVAIAVAALAGLDHAHRLVDDDGRPLHVIHRDVSPENVLVGFAGAVKLVDFGVAKAVAVSSERTGTRRGKLPYMAPEQVEGDPVDARTDVYALGVVVYELLAGRPPLVRPTEPRLILAIRDDEPPPLGELRPDLSPVLAAAVHRALAKCPDQRFASASAMAAALGAPLLDAAAIAAFMRELFGAAASDTSADPPAPRTALATIALAVRSRPRLRWATLGLALLAASVALVLGARSRPPEVCNGVDDDGNGAIDDRRGCLRTLAGSGPPGFVDGLAMNARFARPAFLAIALDGALLVADRDNHAIRRVELDGTGRVTTLAGRGRCGFRDGPVAEAELCEPFDIEPAPDGALYFTDRRNHRVRVLRRGRVDTIAGGGPARQAALVDGAALGAARLNEPSGLALLPNGDLLIADRANDRVRRYVRASATLVTEAGAGDGQAQGTRLSAALEAPVDVAVDRAGTLYVSERIGNRIRKLPLSGPAVILAGSASGRAGDADGAGEAALLSSPGQMVLDEAGGWLIFAAEGNHRIRAVPLGGGPTRTWAGAVGWGYSNGPNTEALFHTPLGLIRSGGRSFVADGNHVIRELTGTEIVDLAGGRASEGTRDGLAAHATLRRARGLVRQPDGTLLWVELDTGTLRRLGTDGRVQTLVAGGRAARDGSFAEARFVRPYDTALGPDGRLYVADEEAGAVRVVDLVRRRVDTLAGGGVPARGHVDGSLAQARFRGPRALALGADAAGALALYVADAGNFVVRKIALGAGTVSTVAGTAGVRGTAGGGPGEGQLASVRALAASAGTLYIADGRRVRRVGPDGVLRLMMTLAFDPEAITLDGDRLIAVGDRIVVAVSLGTAATVETLLEGRRGWQDGPVGEAGMSMLTSVVITPGALVFTDAGSGRIRALSR